MAKIIKLTPEYIEEARRDFEETLQNIKLSDGKINFCKSFNSITRRATVYFTEIAWEKMQSLIREFDKEVAWHGVAFRGEDPDKDEYTITDILVYPQEVTGATVTTDQVKYQTWLMEHEDDVFNNIRMQGHSHVNMSTSPSSVDTTLYERILDQLDDTMFYIFLIYNKRGDKTYKIYDLAKNVLFETSDVTVKIIGKDFDLDSFIRDAKDKVTDRVYTYGAYGQANGTAGRQIGVVPAQQPAKQASAAAPAAGKVTQLPVKASESKKESEKEASSVGFRKGKRKNKDDAKVEAYSGYGKGSYCNASYDDDDIYGYDDPYGPYGWRDGRWY